MSTVTLTLAPIFLLIVLGAVLRATRFLSYWWAAERLTYFILFPALLVANLAEARLEGLPVAGMAGAQAGGVAAMAVLVLAFRSSLGRPPWRLDGAGFTSLFQGCIRPNTYVGLAVAAGLFGVQGLTLTAICVATAVPLVNLLSVVVMVRHAGKEGASRPWREAVMPVVRNPLIAACLTGIALNLTGIGLPPVVGPFLKILGAASLPLGLLAVGAGLDLRGLRHTGAPVVLSAVAKLAVLPLLTACGGWLLGLGGLPLAVCVAYAALPCAPNAYMLARQMGGDAGLMAKIITAQTVVAAATLPALLVALG